MRKREWNDEAPSISEVIEGGLGTKAAVSGASHVIRVNGPDGNGFLFLLSTPEYREWLKRRPEIATGPVQRHDAFGAVRSSPRYRDR